MSIALVTTRGYGNGTLETDIAHVVTAGYGIGEAVEVPDVPGVTAPTFVAVNRDSGNAPWTPPHVRAVAGHRKRLLERLRRRREREEERIIFSIFDFGEGE